MWLYVYQDWSNFNENNIFILWAWYVFLILIIIKNCWSFVRDTSLYKNSE